MIKISMSSDYEGFSSHETWAANLMLNNDPNLYTKMLHWLKKQKEADIEPSYKNLIIDIPLRNTRDVNWKSPKINVKEMDEELIELSKEI